MAIYEKKNEKDVEPDEIVISGKDSQLTLKKTIDKNGNVFYKAPLNWRVPENTEE
jgi:hypothetical protein